MGSFYTWRLEGITPSYKTPTSFGPQEAPRLSSLLAKTVNSASLSSSFSALVILWERELKKKLQR